MEEVNYDEVFSSVPYAADHGKLDNGLSYYVRRNSNPEGKAALSLAVNVGPMVEERSHVHLSFPFELGDRGKVTGKKANAGSTLRKRRGIVGRARGDMSIGFSCHPDLAETLVDASLDEIERFQAEGPSDADISVVLESYRQLYETGLQDNKWWLERIVEAYKSSYSGEVGLGVASSVKIEEDLRSEAIHTFTPPVARSALQRLLPFPCKSLFTAVIRSPYEASRSRMIRSIITDPKVLAGMVVVASFLWRYFRTSSRV